jgi:dihydrofolate reductase
MGVSILDMSVSLDGYIADAGDYLGGDDGERLHKWADAEGSRLSRRRRSGSSTLSGRRPARFSRDGGLPSSWITGAAVMAASDLRASHRPPPPAARWGYPLVTYVNDGIESAMAQAKAAAGDRDVQVRGAYTGQQALEAGVLHEIQIHLIPVLLGRGRRLFDVLPSEVELEIVRVINTRRRRTSAIASVAEPT